MADISIANLDAGTDSPRLARIEILDAIKRLNAVECYSPRYLGAPSDGSADDSSYMAAILLLTKRLDLSGRAWKISATVTLPAGAVVDMRGATVTAATGATPIFAFAAAGDNLAIMGGTVTGTASAFLALTGSTSTPTASGHYARQIRLSGVHVTSATIGLAIDMTLAVRQVFIDSCQLYTASGISGVGKCVEVKVTKSVIYSSTSAAGTFGVRLQSPAGSTYYNEGWHFTDCTIDAFETTFDVDDIFVLTVTGGFAGCAPGGYVLDAGNPTGNLCSDIRLTGVPISGRVRFAPSSGRDYAATLNACTSLNISGVNIQLANNAAGITIRSHKFRASTSGVAVEMVSNNANCVVDGFDCDSTFIGGVQVKGASGAGCAVTGAVYAGTGDPVYIERLVRISGVPVATSPVASYRQVFNAASLQASRAVGVDIGSVTTGFVKGETGVVVVELSLSGMNATTQRIDVGVPAQLTTPTGTGWNALNIMPNTAGGRLSVRIPYYCTADLASGTVKVTNAAGNTVAVDYHSWVGVVKDW